MNADTGLADDNDVFMNNDGNQRTSWHAYVATLAVALPLLYVLTSGPCLALIDRYGVGSESKTAYAPLVWLEQETPLHRPLEWYWDLFDFLRPEDSPDFRAIERNLGID